MRIVLLSNLYPPYIEGGAEVAAEAIVQGLRDRGHEVMVLSSSYGCPAPQQNEYIYRSLSYSPAPHFELQCSIAQQLRHIYSYYRHFHHPANKRKLHQMLTTFRPDILYIWEITGIGVCSILSLLLTLSIPIVFHLGSYWYQYVCSAKTAFSRLPLRSCKQLLIGHVPRLQYTSLIATSETIKEEYGRAGCDPSRIEVIYNAVPPSFLTLPYLRDGPRPIQQTLQLLFVGRLCLEKGILVLLHTLDFLMNQQGKSNLHLHICGNGDKAFVQRIKHLINSMRIADIVTFHGRLRQEELLAHYDRADILLVPSLWLEPFGLVIVEAMARGLPVIASGIGGPAEILTHGKDGLLIEPGNQQALADAIVSLWERPEQRARFALQARATVEARFTLDYIVQRIEQHLLRGILRYGPVS